MSLSGQALVAAYEAAEVSYFAAVTATTPVVQQFVASNSSEWAPNPDMGCATSLDGNRRDRCLRFGDWIAVLAERAHMQAD